MRPPRPTRVPSRSSRPSTRTPPLHRVPGPAIRREASWIASGGARHAATSTRRRLGVRLGRACRPRARERLRDALHRRLGAMALMPHHTATQAHLGREWSIVQELETASSEARWVLLDEGLDAVGHVEPFGSDGCEDEWLASRHGLEHLDPRAAALPERGDDRPRRAIERIQGRRVGDELDCRASNERANLIRGSSTGDDEPRVWPLLADPGHDLRYEKLQRIDVDLVAEEADEEQRRIVSKVIWAVWPRNGVRHDMDASGH